MSAASGEAVRDDDADYRYCEWYEQENGSVVTSCGARLKDHALFKKCPKCKAGRIGFCDYQDDTEYDDEEYADDE